MSDLFQIFGQLETNLGWWSADGVEPSSNERDQKEAVFNIHNPFYIVRNDRKLAIGVGGTGVFGKRTESANSLPIAAYVPACRIKSLGDPSFCAEHGMLYPYVAGSMANGISSCDMVEAMGQNGMLGFFGSAGLPIESVESAIDRISGHLTDGPYGFDLIHSPNDPDLEASLVDLYLRRGVKLVEASAYMDLTLPVVRYRVHGIHCNSSGDIVTPNRIIAKISRVEVASKFFAPPPDRFLGELISQGNLTQEQARLAAQIPMAQDLTAEADSGGHTDKRPATALLPTILALRDRMQDRFRFKQTLRVGTAGGISTPPSAAAAFAMGAAYVMTGSINQACVESGTSIDVKEMLAQAQQGDVTMAPAADMFEMGVTVQVLKRGTMFAMRASKLYEAYCAFNSIQEIPASVRSMIEKNIFHDSFETIWNETRGYFLNSDPTQVERAEADPKHLMALIFRWYLGKTSRWATSGEASRRIDYQIWCGPAMAAFNEWVKDSFLAHLDQRKVVTVALNLLYGAAVIMRINNLRSQGIMFSPHLLRVVPIKQEQIKEYLS
ncbi:MAG: PfaD family polyunsaturated fatty acid/polyketide biosynthesis protein [Deltaproteobacteria bacterium]|nr:PfaD family polyunsaturated fatty acid/polyketide biosynthesis protein [Deltaproteobacteria bacterium]MBW2342723.1 PfaD family polyunsaturated fatty acid/polyketide biosynthesis protein [Deltaproteobacteria bacterium]